ncbi:hypothetical protein AB0D24_27210 [Streptomyces javensis]|uniref:hypothetical protein n=1 Tax=Streptomyces javensis TaxID=114698 RepID=UPI0033EDBECC
MKSVGPGECAHSGGHGLAQFGRCEDFDSGTEAQPGPLDYGRTHADGANLLAGAVRPYGGVVMWRAFVHDTDAKWDRQAYLDFTPLDGKFADNAIVQIKNGPIDFQVREPAHPLFGSLPRTNSMIEFQVTQEYTGHATHLCYLVSRWTAGPPDAMWIWSCPRRRTRPGISAPAWYWRTARSGSSRDQRCPVGNGSVLSLDGG